jgi:CHAT domain-containing protein
MKTVAFTPIYSEAENIEKLLIQIYTALSGLHRSFLYAGSEALLVTHGPVASASARLLVTDIVERQAVDTKLSHAEALRQSMLAVMEQKNTTANFTYAHSLSRAPYALVGVGEI